jgi:hypothetical protein
MIPINFQFIWLSGLAGDLKKKKDHPETRSAYDGHVCLLIETKLEIFIEDLP